MKLRAFFRIIISRKICSLLLKPAFTTIIIITIITDSKSDIKSLFEPLSAPDSEPGEKYDFKSDSKVEDISLAPLKSRDSVSFSFS